MRHLKAGRKLGRNASHRLALMRNLTRALIEHERIITTVEKAKEARPFVEKLITLAKKGDLHARRLALSRLPDRDAVAKLFSDIGPQFEDRNGGYTRIIKLSDYRIGDGGSLVLLQLLTEESKPTGTARRSAGLRRKRNERRHQFASRALKRDRGEKTSEGEQSAPTDSKEQ